MPNRFLELTSDLVPRFILIWAVPPPFFIMVYGVLVNKDQIGFLSREQPTGRYRRQLLLSAVL